MKFMRVRGGEFGGQLRKKKEFCVCVRKYVNKKCKKFG